MTAVDELREAATGMRELAEAATRGPWVTYPTALDTEGAWTVTRPRCDYEDIRDCEDDCGAPVFSTGAEGCEEDSITRADAAYIASWHPGVALAVADWLDVNAAWHDVNPDAVDGCTHAALAVARAYLGRQP